MSWILGAQDGSEQEPSLVALFTFVARDPMSQRAMKINPLAPSTPLQKQRFAERQQVADRRKEARRTGKDSSSEGALTLCPRTCAAVQEGVQMAPGCCKIGLLPIRTDTSIDAVIINVEFACGPERHEKTHHH